jgi:hypothetical protein
MREVKSSEASPGGWLKIKADVAALKGNDKVKALHTLHSSIEQIIQHKAETLNRAPVGTTHA